MWDEFYQNFGGGRRNLIALTQKVRDLLKQEGYPSTLSKLCFKNKKTRMQHRNYFYFTFVKKFVRNW